MIKYEFTYYTSVSKEETKKIFEREFGQECGFCDIEAKYVEEKERTYRERVNGVRHKVVEKYTEATVYCYMNEDLEPRKVEGIINNWLIEKGCDDKVGGCEFLWKEFA